MVDPHLHGAADAAMKEERYNRARYGLPSLIGALPDPDAVFRKAGLDHWMARELSADPHLYGAISQRRSALLDLEFRIDAGGKIPGIKEKAAAEMYADILENITGGEGLDRNSLFALLGQASLYGFQPVEIIWETGQSEWRPVRFRDRPQEWFGWDSATEEFRFYKLGDLAGEPVPPEKILLPRHYPTFHNPMGEKVLSRCFWPVTFKKGGLRFWAQLLERFGQPWLIGKGNPGDADNLLTALERMYQNAIAVLPQGAEVDIREAAAGKGEDFERFARYQDAAISEVVIGQTLSMNVDGKGSYAAAETHNQVRKDIAYGDAKITASALNRLARMVTDFNFGPAVAAPKAIFYEENAPRKELMDRDKLFVDMGYRPAKEYLEKTFNVQLEPYAGSTTDKSGRAPHEQTANALLNSLAPEGEGESDAIASMAMAQAAQVAKRTADAIAARMEKAADFEEAKLILRELAGETPASLASFAEILGDAQILARGIGTAEVMAETPSPALANSDMPELGVKFGLLTPDAAIAYLKAKGYALSWGWRDVRQEEHALSFTVAKCMRLDILKDIKDALEKAQVEGHPFAQFKKGLAPMLQEKGWWGESPFTVDGAGDPAQLGSDHRLQTIFRVNMQTAYQAGRWKGFWANKESRPYLVYSAVLDRRTRPAHAALHGSVWNIDDPNINQIYPPNGWRCRCTMRSMSPDDLAASGKAVSTELPEGIDRIAPPEWRYNVGIAAQRAEMLQQTLKQKNTDLMEGL